MGSTHAHLLLSKKRKETRTREADIRLVREKWTKRDVVVNGYVGKVKRER
jgi:hypothetical protein